MVLGTICLGQQIDVLTSEATGSGLLPGPSLFTDLGGTVSRLDKMKEKSYLHVALFAWVSEEGGGLPPHPNSSLWCLRVSEGSSGSWAIS